MLERPRRRRASYCMHVQYLNVMYCAVLYHILCNPTLLVTWSPRGPHALYLPLPPGYILLCYILHITHNQSHAISLSRLSFLVCPLHNFYFLLVAERKTAAIGLQKAPLIVILSAGYPPSTYIHPQRVRAHELVLSLPSTWQRSVLMHGMIPQETLRGDQWRFRWFLATQCLLSPKALAEPRTAEICRI